MAEHDKYCNIYHSCILGQYKMYVCVAIGTYDKRSYFSYMTGDCAAPSEINCPSDKSVYPYEKALSLDNNNNKNKARKYSINNNKQQAQSVATTLPVTHSSTTLTQATTQPIVGGTSTPSLVYKKFFQDVRLKPLRRN